MTCEASARLGPSSLLRRESTLLASKRARSLSVSARNRGKKDDQEKEHNKRRKRRKETFRADVEDEQIKGVSVDRGSVAFVSRLETNVKKTIDLAILDDLLESNGVLLKQGSEYLSGLDSQTLGSVVVEDDVLQVLQDSDLHENSLVGIFFFFFFSPKKKKRKGKERMSWLTDLLRPGC